MGPKVEEKVLCLRALYLRVSPVCIPGLLPEAGACGRGSRAAAPPCSCPGSGADGRGCSGVQRAGMPHAVPKDGDSTSCGLRSKPAPSAEPVPELI